ncbi:MAG: hypothetical protein ACI86H_000278 [bacterium]|jgi:hypothetical protein
MKDNPNSKWPAYKPETPFLQKKESFKVDEFEDNPMVGYLKLFQNQHSLIYSLYRGLIITFAIFLGLVSIFTFNVMDNQLVPNWGSYLLGGINVLLFFGMIKGIKELRKFKLKSLSILQQVSGYLNNDLVQLEKIKVGMKTLKKAQVEKVNVQKIKVHQGWDYQICPHCHKKIEMLQDFCPHCQKNFGNRKPS